MCSSASVLSGRKGGMTAVNKGRMMFDFSNMSSQMGSVTAQQHEDSETGTHFTAGSCKITKPWLLNQISLQYYVPVTSDVNHL